MRTTRMVCFLLLAAGCATATPAKQDDVAARRAPLAADGERIELPLGGQHVMPLAGVTSFATSADVVQVKTREDGRQLVLDAVKPGDSALTLLYGDGTIRSYAIHVSATTPQ